jgi:hypothetical protein
VIAITVMAMTTLRPISEAECRRRRETSALIDAIYQTLPVHAAFRDAGREHEMLVRRARSADDCLSCAAGEGTESTSEDLIACNERPMGRAIRAEGGRRDVSRQYKQFVVIAGPNCHQVADRSDRAQSTLHGCLMCCLAAHTSRSHRTPAFGFSSFPPAMISIDASSPTARPHTHQIWRVSHSKPRLLPRAVLRRNHPLSAAVHVTDHKPLPHQ